MVVPLTFLILPLNEKMTLRTWSVMRAALRKGRRDSLHNLLLDSLHVPRPLRLSMHVVHSHGQVVLFFFVIGCWSVIDIHGVYVRRVSVEIEMLYEDRNIPT